MTTEHHQWKGHAVGEVACVKQISGALMNACVDVFQRMEEGDPACGLPFSINATSLIRNADGTGTPVALRMTLIVEAISPEDVGPEPGR